MQRPKNRSGSVFRLTRSQRRVSISKTPQTDGEPPGIDSRPRRLLGFSGPAGRHIGSISCPYDPRRYHRVRRSQGLPSAPAKAPVAKGGQAGLGVRR
jgi:hypothetical protein